MNKYKLKLTPTYVNAGQLFVGPACRAGALFPGPVQLIAPGVASPLQCNINAGFGISGLRRLYSVMRLEVGDTITYTVNAPNTITILSHLRASTNEGQSKVGSGAMPPAMRGPKWMTNRLRYRKLADENQQFIAHEIARLIPVAVTPGHSRRTARFLIDSLLWVWTADGIDEQGEAGRDKLKYDCMRQFHTVDARKCWEQNKGKGTGLRHEHAVPRKQLIAWLLDQSPHLSPADVQAFLRRLCFAVVITIDEDRVLKAKGVNDKLPEEWDWNADGDARLLRYDNAGLIGMVRPPSCNE